MSIIFVIISIFIGVLGSLIWRFQWIGLLSNVDKATVIDKSGLARWAGSCLLSLATVIMCEGIVLEFVETNQGELLVCMLFMFTTQMTVVIYLSGLHRYTK